MQKYLFFYKDNAIKPVRKILVTATLKRELKVKGYRKHHVEVEAENEKDALLKFSEFNNDYSDALKDLSKSAVVCSVVVILIFVFYIATKW